MRLLYLCLMMGLGWSCSTGNYPDPEGNRYITWREYRGDAGSTAYSELNQINKNNVTGLQVAWVFRTGDNKDGTAIQCNPIVIDSVMYVSSAALKIFALDAATGKKLWEFDPARHGREATAELGGTNRGLVYWEDGEDKRLFYCVLHELKAIDARTGLPVQEFGRNGSVDLRDGLDREFDKETAFIRYTSPGVIYKDLIIIGSTVDEVRGSLPGHIRAYNVRTGQLEWIFHTIPHPGEFGYDTWPPEYYKIGGGANAWGGLSIDRERGMVFVPTGSPTHDFYGADRIGKGLFANSVIALDAATGRYIWHFQVSHHDLWDYDLPAPPNLVTVTHNGRTIDAVAQVTKQGFVFLLDRDTGKPLFEVVERPVPPSNVEGEQAWPTQPFPVKPPPLARQYFDTSLVTDITPESRANILEQIRGYTLGGIYTPPSVAGVIQQPGFRGGAEWSGAAIDPHQAIMYIGVNDMPHMVQLVKDSPGTEDISEFDNLAEFGRAVYLRHCAACHGPDREGTVSFPSLLNLQDSMDLTTAWQQLETGKGMMPSFKAVPQLHRRAVLAYLYNLDNEEARRLIPVSDTLTTQAPDTGAQQVRYKLKAYKQLRDQYGYPGIKPPWGNLCAVDLNTGEIRWKRPLGEYAELTARGIPPTGTQLFGGAIVTAGGLVFIGASRDEKFRAFDKDTGELLWEYQLPAGGYATPATYMINGTQYVVIAAGGGGLQGTRSGDYFIAFSLPAKPGNRTD